VLETLAQARETAPDPEALERAARGNSATGACPGISGAERAPDSQAEMRHCHEPSRSRRLAHRLVFYEEGRFNPAGFVHLACRATTSRARRPGSVLHFSPDLSEEERAELARACGDTVDPPPPRVMP